MHCTVKLICLVVLSAKYSYQQNCLTWEKTTDNLILTCMIENLYMNVVFKSPSGMEVANCSKNNCTPLFQEDKIFQNAELHETIFIVRLSGSIDIDGIWTCAHASLYLDVNVTKVWGDKSDVDVLLLGNVTFTSPSLFVFTLSCFSCSSPQNTNAEFQVNNKTTEFVTFRDNKCYNSSNECSQNYCSCSKTAKKYTWMYRMEDVLFPVIFSCSMRFVNDKRSTVYSRYGGLLYNGKDFTYIKIDSTDSVDLLDESSENKPKTNWNKPKSVTLWIGLGTMFVLLIVVIIVLVMRSGKNRLRNLCSCPSRDKDEELKCLLDTNDDEADIILPPKCNVCGVLTTYAFCTVRKMFICETCSSHRCNSLGQNLVQIANIYGKENSLTCCGCQNDKPECICTICKKLFCSGCSSKCQHYTAILPLVFIQNKQLYKSLSEINGAYLSLHKRSEINIQEGKGTVRIRGIAMLTEDIIVIADYKHWTLKVYNRNDNVKNISLSDEPRGMVGISDQTVGVTLSYKKQIHLIDVFTLSKKVINTKKLGKPFSIAYDKKHLIVEFGEGEDGFVALLDMNGNVLFKTKEHDDLGFFTGNTLRLALDMDAKRFYVSAMGKQEISCINFKLKVVWKERATSPRGIVTNHSVENQDKLIILASKKCNALYQINPKSGKKNMIESIDVIECPRYIANYQLNKSNIVAIEQNGIIGVYDIIKKDE